MPSGAGLWGYANFVLTEFSKFARARSRRCGSRSLRDPAGGEILGPLQGEEVRRMAKDTQEVSGSNGPVGEPEPAVRGGGLPLPGLKHWRERRGISQAKLARRADLSSDYLFKVESGRRACRPEAAELIADRLGV